MIGRRKLLSLFGFGGAAAAVPVAIATAAPADANALPMWVEPRGEAGFALKVICADGKHRTVFEWIVEDKDAPTDVVPLAIHYQKPSDLKLFSASFDA